MSGKNDEKRLFAALEDLAPLAAMGLMAEGLVHNLSGVAQAISMQTDILGMAFEKMREKVADLDAAGDSEPLGDLCALIEEKSAIIDRLTNKGEEMQRLLHTAAGFVFSEPGSIPVIVLDMVVDELDLAETDMFFKHKVKKKVDITPSLPVLTACRHDLQMALHQLLRNSIEALAAAGTPEPEIIIRADHHEGRLRIGVEDNGQGDPEIIDRVFAPFFSTRDGHSGLGLWLAQSLLARNHGRIVCESLASPVRFVIELDL